MGSVLPRKGGISAPMPAPSESLVALESRLAEALLEFERLDAAWPKGRTAIERAKIGRRREDALSEIATLRHRIATGRAQTLADAAVQLRRLVAEADTEGSSLRGLLGEPDMRKLVASVLAVVEREADAESTPAAESAASPKTCSLAAMCRATFMV